MHSFGDWLRQIKGDTGKKKKSATASVVCLLGAWVEGEDCCRVGGERRQSLRRKRQVLVYE